MRAANILKTAKFKLDQILNDLHKGLKVTLSKTAVMSEFWKERNVKNVVNKEYLSQIIYSKYKHLFWKIIKERKTKTKSRNLQVSQNKSRKCCQTAPLRKTDELFAETLSTLGNGVFLCWDVQSGRCVCAASTLLKCFRSGPRIQTPNAEFSVKHLFQFVKAKSFCKIVIKYCKKVRL